MTDALDRSVVYPRNKADIMATVQKEAIRILRLPEHEIRPDTDLTVMMDSLDAMNMLLSLNRRFTVDIGESNMGELQTPERITNVVLRCLERAGQVPSPLRDYRNARVK